MPYLARRPCHALSTLIEFVGVQESDTYCSNDPHTRILPTGTIDLVLHYGDRFLQFASDGPQQEPVAYATGQRMRPIEVAATGKTGIVVVGLFPWAAPSVLACNAADLQGRTCDLDHFLPKAAIREVIEQLSLAENGPVRLSIVESFLLKNITEHEDSLVRHAVCLLRNEPAFRIRSMATTLGISKRQLNRRFGQNVGISPKQFARVMRFQQALASLNQGVQPGHAAQDAGYYDQPHMNHEFEEIAGTSPDRLFRDRVATPLMASFNGTVSSFYNTLYLN